MKCVCGYEGGDFVILEEMTVCHKTVRETYRGSPFNSLGASDDRKRVYACPKCGVLRIEVD